MKPSSLMSIRSENPKVYRGPESAEMHIVNHALLNATAQARDLIYFSTGFRGRSRQNFPASISAATSAATSSFYFDQVILFF
jgi:hypothetical protein